MEVIIENMEVILHNVILVAKLLLEYVGTAIIVITGVRGLIGYLKKDSNTKVILAEGMSMSLEFMLGSEILRTVIAPDQTEILVIGGIIVLRVALTLLLHWEIGEEHKHMKEEDDQEHGQEH